MLANVVPPTNDFHALARYLVNGKSGTKPSPKRVAWTIAQNLPTDDPALAATYMSATARLSRRCTNAAYHAMIAWHTNERPTPEAMQSIALQTLGLAGLAEHQALIMGHGDKPHAHLHLLINRVHPETGKAWATSHDYRRFDAIMRQLSDEHGFLYVPAHRFNPELTDDQLTKPGKRATYAAKRGASTTRTQWSKHASRELGDEMSEDIGSVTSWADLDAAFALRALKLEAKGKGLVAGNETAYTKFSALGLTVTADELEKRFGEPYIAFEKRKAKRSRPWFEVDAIDIVKALTTIGLTDKGDLRRAIDDKNSARSEKLAAAPLAMQAMRDVKLSLRASTSLKQHQQFRRCISSAPMKRNNLSQHAPAYR